RLPWPERPLPLISSLTQDCSTAKATSSSRPCSHWPERPIKPFEKARHWGGARGGFNNRSRRREEADLCNKSSSASSRRRLRRLGRFLNPPWRCAAACQRPPWLFTPTISWPMLDESFG